MNALNEWINPVKLQLTRKRVHLKLAVWRTMKCSFAKYILFITHGQIECQLSPIELNSITYHGYQFKRQIIKTENIKWNIVPTPSHRLYIFVSTFITKIFFQHSSQWNMKQRCWKSVGLKSLAFSLSLAEVEGYTQMSKHSILHC